MAPSTSKSGMSEGEKGTWLCTERREGAEGRGARSGHMEPYGSIWRGSQVWCILFEALGLNAVKPSPRRGYRQTGRPGDTLRRQEKRYGQGVTEGSLERKGFGGGSIRLFPWPVTQI